MSAVAFHLSAPGTPAPCGYPGCIAGAYYLFVEKPKSAGTKGPSSGSDSVFDSFGSSNQVELGIAYGQYFIYN